VKKDVKKKKNKEKEKKGDTVPSSNVSPDFSVLQLYYVYSLRTFGTLLDLKFHFLTFV